MSILTKLAMKWLAFAMKHDASYAWSWHCNIAMVAKDTATDVCDVGYSEQLHERAQIRTRDFMWYCFGVDTLANTPHKIERGGEGK